MDAAPCLVTPVTLDSVLEGDQAPTRIHIVGTSGSGKSTLARRLGEVLGLPVHDLDTVARVGGGRGPLRSDAERQAAVAGIVEQPGWITEGVHVGWTKPLLERAQLIIWLDHLPTSVAQRRVVVRFLRSAATEARRRKGHERLLRFRDYAAQMRGLVAHLHSMQSDDVQSRHASETRGVLTDELKAHSDRVLHCECEADVEVLMDRMTSLVTNAPKH